MDAKQRALVAFHLTGKRLDESLQPLDGLRPALLARYRDLTGLRYDFPLVLAEDGVHSLSRLVDRAAQASIPRGPAGEPRRRALLRLEREIRVRLARGERGTLREMARGEALEPDGELVDCDPDLPRRLLMHLGRLDQRERLRRETEALDRLALGLEDILRADQANSLEGRTPERLRASFGLCHQEAFDFQAMATVLNRPSRAHSLPPGRRQRVERTLAALRQGRGLLEPGAPLVFESCQEALEALQSRLPAMVELVKAMAVGLLEVEGRYVPEQHDAFFESFDRRSLAPADLARFPWPLVCLDGSRMSPADHQLLSEVLASDLPIKVLVCCRDLVGESPLGDGSLVLSARGARLASLAVGLGQAFVVQAAASYLYQVRHHLAAGLAFPGPALFSIYAPGSGALPAYLQAAAAMQARAFPAFVYDPAAPDLAARFHLADNPQEEADWPVERLEYQDPEHQRVIEQTAFTLLDFLALVPGQEQHFARVSAGPGMVPAAEWLEQDQPPPDQVPYLLMADPEGLLHRVVADEAAVQAARRCRKLWRTLQEMGGVGNSHARLAAERERRLWEEEIERLKAAAAAPNGQGAARAASPAPEVPQAEAAPPAQAPAEAPPAPPPPERDPDEPYIETARCSSCNECININPRMFAYNANKQAYIADPTAGTYRQLVEAAESCQVAVIHPGKPRDPNEPGLEELLARAAPFMS